MTEVHTTEVTRDEWYSCELASILEQRGFTTKEGEMMLGITCETQDNGMVKVVQRVEVISTVGEVKDLQQKTCVMERLSIDEEDNFQVRGKSQAEEAMLVLKDAEKKFIRKVVQDKMRNIQAQLWKEGKPEHVEGIRFQKIWRIPEAEYRVHSLRDILISQGARHTGKRLEGVVGYDWQEDGVVVVQTVLVSECSVSGTSE